MEIGRGTAQLHSDNEPALLALIKSTIAKMGTGLSYRTGPNYSPQSQGDIERAHGTLLAQLRTMLDDTCKRYNMKRLEITHPLFNWCVLHCNFLLNRYLVKSDGKKHPTAEDGRKSTTHHCANLQRLSCTNCHNQEPTLTSAGEEDSGWEEALSTMSFS